MPCSFQSFCSNSSKNELWVGRCGGRSRAHHKYTFNSKHPLKVHSFHCSSGYSIYSFAQLSCCPSTALGRKNFECPILDSYFSILFPSPFLFTVFYSKTSQAELWMVRSLFSFSHPIFLSLFLVKNLQFQLWTVRLWIPTFLMPFSFQSFFSISSKNELWVGRCGGRGRAHHKYMLNSKHPLRKSLFS